MELAGSTVIQLNPAALVAKGLFFALTAAAQEDLAPRGDFEAQRVLSAGMAAIAEGQVLGIAAGAALVGSGIKGDGNGHAGAVVGLFHWFSLG
jgi:hypothetical protein